MECSGPVPSADYLSKSKPERNSSADRKLLGTSANNLPRGCQNMKLQDKLNPRKPRPSYADFHHEITKNTDLVPHKFSGDHPRKQRIGGKEVDEDELVKYMSNLPNYLQRGETLKEKALNVGVLDWGLLEKWKYGQKQMPCKSNWYSPTSSNTSSSFSTDESSIHSSGGHSVSPTRQRARRYSLQLQMTSSLVEGPSHVVESSAESLRKYQVVRSSQSGGLSRSENFVTASSSLSKELNTERNLECEKLKNNVNIRTMTSTMTNPGEARAVEGKSREEENMQKPKLQNSELNSHGNKRIVLLLPKSTSESSNLGEPPQNPKSAALPNRNSKVCQRSFSEGCKKSSHSEVSSNVPYSCPLLSRVDTKEPQAELLSSRDSVSRSVNFPSGSSKSLPQPMNMGSTPSISKCLEAKALEQKPKKVMAERVRSISPFRRFSSGPSKTSKTLGLNDSSNIHNQRSIDEPAKSGTGNCRPSSGDSSGCDKPGANGRARSSPLRRLLEPLLKLKSENRNCSVEPAERVSASTDNACKPSEEQHASLMRPPAKVKLGMTGCKKISVNELAMGKKHGPLTVQALLRVAVKNGLPLYTFAVDNESNILAATMKMLNTEKEVNGFSCVYTFFTIHDMKKRNGSWIGQGAKGKGQDYISNVVAQMKVSDSSAPNIGVRNAVLFSVDLIQSSEGQTPDYHPNDELAAIVVKFPKAASPSSISTTVILPSAVHSLPSKGGPSSLIQRWISGGSCDCGGWDLGCKLRILTNIKKSSSSKSSHPNADRIELFPQGGLQENQQVWSLSTFKEGIYSVEFHSSISVLQAFATCTAVLDTRKQCELVESSHSVEEKASGGESSSVHDAGTSSPSNRTEAEGPRYVSYPPHSPVGRV